MALTIAAIILMNIAIVSYTVREEECTITNTRIFRQIIYDISALLLYTVLHPEEQTDPVMRGFFFKTDETFRTAMMTSCKEPWTLVGAHGPYVYLMCPGHHDQFVQIMRNGSLVQTISRSGETLVGKRRHSFNRGFIAYSYSVSYTHLTLPTIYSV